MSLCKKNRPKCGPAHFCVKIIIELYRGKNPNPNFGLTKYFKKLPKETNRPIGENSPNLVTLPETLFSSVICDSTLFAQQVFLSND
jgi:hypothetical protein